MPSKKWLRQTFSQETCLLKNFGITRNNRVVFYDYDEIRYLTECNFRKIPKARNPEDEMASTPWFSVSEDDVFPEEFERYFLVHPLIGKYFFRNSRLI